MLAQTGCGALACATAASGLPHLAGNNADRLRSRHSVAVGDVTKTVMVTVSLGPSTTITLGATSTNDPCTDRVTSTSSTNLLTTTSSSALSAIVSTMTLTTEIATTTFPSATPLISSSFSSETSGSITTASTTSTTIPPTTLSTASSSSPPSPTPSDADFNPITAPARGGGNHILAQNAADAQALNRKFRELTFGDNCINGDEACIGDTRAFCTSSKWRSSSCTQPNARCRAVPRMQTNGTALGCFTDADTQALFSSTGQPGNAFGE